MGFQVVYVADGEMSNVRNVEHVESIKNFAELSQPYNKMVLMNVPAELGVYELEYVSPDEETELLSVVITCSGYGESDYYNLYCNNEKWFDTWFPTEVKEGLYLGTSTYVYKLPANSKFLLQFVNISGTQKKVWMGIRMLRESVVASDTSIDSILDTEKITTKSREITDEDRSFLEN